MGVALWTCELLLFYNHRKSQFRQSPQELIQITSTVKYCCNLPQMYLLKVNVCALTIIVNILRFCFMSVVCKNHLIIYNRSPKASKKYFSNLYPHPLCLDNEDLKNHIRAIVYLFTVDQHHATKFQ